ncbi:response regulator [Rhodohalobacter sp. SW132]|uniref:response regulator n=1 Tax=Rhodohalobacter sp. SW132 TaxID=2293433 RepID=UPI000E2895DA|nr:response regulator [Rhodohalobacter sp. SW132]REL38714.1 response regulator [Rhodohalobacter sp. SW132]
MSEVSRIRVLLVDDSPDDRELILMNLRRGGYQPIPTEVDTKEAFVDALDAHTWDLIICDYSMPGFDGLTALKILKNRNRDIPFILVSGAIGEELAVKAMKAGAHDYLMKDNLQRLIPAVEREINEARNRKKQKEAEQERDRLLTVIQHSLNEIFIFDSKTLRFRYLNETAANNLGYSEDEFSKLTPIDISPQIDNRADFERIIQPLRDGRMEKEFFVTKHTRKDGSTYPIEIHIQLIKQGNDPFFTAIGFDMSDREKDARRIKEHKDIAREMALHSKYKSEFLANMSHELRTPLNSITLLSKLLMKAKDKNLTADQSNFVDVIHQSGNNLLELINEVLDLSKIESGEMELSLSRINRQNLVSDIRNLFAPLADEKKLVFDISVDNTLPDQITTDRMRLEQVLKNLLSNAFKFTDEGSVALRVFSPEPGNRAVLKQEMIGFSVSDTGIGIPKEKQSLVFESFQQADGSTQRRYGGTGLGLTICRQISELLGGSITLESQEGAGSTFTLLLPVDSTEFVEKSRSSLKTTSDGELQRELKLSPAPVKDSEPITPKQKYSAKILLATDSSRLQSKIKSIAGTKNIELSIVTSGENIAPEADRFQPDFLILDPYITHMSGWSFSKMISRRSNIPVWLAENPGKVLPPMIHNTVQGVIYDASAGQDLQSMLDTDRKTADPACQTLLLVDDNEMHNTALREFALEFVDRCITATSAREAYDVLENQSIDCVVLDLSLPDASGADVLKKLSDDDHLSRIPVIIYSGKSLSASEKSFLMEHASDIILKNVGSHSRLMKKIGELTGNSLPDHNLSDPFDFSRLAGRSVLIVDDDQRSYFSLSSHLKEYNIITEHAESGKAALQKLNNTSYHAVLLDVMMPDMDGHELLKEIRRNSRWKDLPIFSVTARAMRGDRETCLELGATDYISKPVDPDIILTLLSIWIAE